MAALLFIAMSLGMATANVVAFPRNDGGAAAPAVTPRVLLPRVNYKTMAYYATTAGTSVSYAPWEYDIDATTYTTSSRYFRRCPIGVNCAMYTTCSSGYLVAAGTSTFCGTGGGASALYCSSHVLYTTSGASNPYSWIWCDQSPLTGVTFYETRPGASSASSATPSSTAASATTTASSGSLVGSASTRSTGTVAPATVTAQPTDNKSSAPIGAIVGGVVGGIAVLGAIGVAIFFILRRKKSKAAPAHAAGTVSYAPVAPTSPGQMPPPGYYNPSEKPQGQANVYAHQAPAQAPYQNYPYDPNNQQYNAHMSPTAGSVVSPIPQSPPQQHGQAFGAELPATRM